MKPEEDDVLAAIYKADQSKQLIREMHLLQLPITDRSALGNSVRDTLLIMSKCQFKKAQSISSRIVEQGMDEVSNDEDVPVTSVHGMPLHVCPSLGPVIDVGDVSEVSDVGV